MKLKRIVALMAALMLFWTIAYADTTATRIYDAVADLLTNTTNVTLTGNATFSLDGKQFKTVETTYEQDGVNSRWVLNMTSPRANGSLKNSGFTIIANNRFKYAMEVFNPGTYKFVECDPQTAILRSSVVLTQLVSLGHTVVNQIPEWSGNEVFRTNDGKLSIHLTEEQIPVSVNDLLGLGVLLAVQRTLSIVDDSVVTPAYPNEANTFEASVASTTPARAIISHTEKYELTALSAEIGMDESGRLTEASGTAHFVLHTFQDGDHELDISFSGKVFDYGSSHVPAFDATEYKVVPEIGNGFPISETVNAEYGEKTSGRTSEMHTDGDTVLYYNPDGGSRYHVDMNCPSTNPRYLPFSGQFTYAEVNDEAYILLMPCNVCDAPLR